MNITFLKLAPFVTIWLLSIWLVLCFIVLNTIMIYFNNRFFYIHFPEHRPKDTYETSYWEVFRLFIFCILILLLIIITKYIWISL